MTKQSPNSGCAAGADITLEDAQINRTATEIDPLTEKEIEERLAKTIEPPDGGRYLLYYLII